MSHAEAYPDFTRNERIADALERLAPQPAEPVDLTSGDAFSWDGSCIGLIDPFSPISIDLLTGIDDQKSRVLDNTSRHARGHAAHDLSRHRASDRVRRAD